MAIRCSVCHEEYDIGQHPWCPHGKVMMRKDGRWFPFESYVDQHIAPQPVEITGPGHRNQLMRERGLEVRPREHINDLNQRRWSKGLPPLER